MFTETIEHVYLFMERGGDVLYGIAFVIFLLWLFILERIVYFSFSHRPLLSSAINEWEQRKERKSWSAHQIRQDLIISIEDSLENNMSTIKMLVGLCPLFGLLGTVSGMIDVFEIMSFVGSGSPKAMAAGISKATIPTMAGMVGALTGVFGQSLLDRYIKRQKTILENKMTFDH
jgi:biopolymer transport protein ExbB